MPPIAIHRDVTAAALSATFEGIVTGPVNDTMFDMTVVGALGIVTANLYSAQQTPEPCDGNYDDLCTAPIGQVDYCVQ